jgi:citrate lyase subunit beta/citryl-CoA lyase
VPPGCAHAEEANQVSTAPLRSMLFVPGDSERKQARALSSGADALILDLEDSVDAAQLPAARARVLEFLRASGRASTAPSSANRAAATAPQATVPQLWVRVNSLESGKLLEDLVAVIGGKPDGVVLPKVSSVKEVAQVGHYLSALEAREGLEIGTTRLLVIATETPNALLALGEYSPASAGPRLAALTWGMEDLSAALGALGKTEPDGSLTPPLQLARSLCLIAAAAAGVQAIDGVQADFRDGKGLANDVSRARRDGFTGKLAIHPDQVPVINAAFSPSAEEIARAKRIVAAFEAAPGVGVTSLDGQMLDRPHLVLARRVLELSARTQATTQTTGSTTAHEASNQR